MVTIMIFIEQSLCPWSFIVSSEAILELATLSENVLKMCVSVCILYVSVCIYKLRRIDFRIHVLKISLLKGPFQWPFQNQ